MNTFLTRSLAPLLVAALGTLMIVFAVTMAIAPRHKHIMMGGSFPAVSVAELFERADAVAIVHPSNDISQHWNNATNSEWTSDSATRMALIVTDQVVEVADVVKGDLPETMTIRLPGGTVRETTFESTLKPLSPDRAYLLFLDWTETPTEEGSDSAWTIYIGPVGRFELNAAGVWANHLEANTIEALELLREP